MWERCEDLSKLSIKPRVILLEWNTIQMIQQANDLGIKVSFKIENMQDYFELVS